MMLLLFGVGENPADVVALLSPYGSAGLAILAVWWMSTKFEKIIGDINTKHSDGFKMLTDTIKGIQLGFDQRDTAYQTLLEKKITAFIGFSEELRKHGDIIRENTRRVEELEKRHRNIDEQKHKERS